MKDFPIPVRTIGPGSQPAPDMELDFMAMPRAMNTFQMPQVPQTTDVAALARSRDLLARMHALIEDWDPQREPQGPCIELTGLDPSTSTITNEVLGEGEVSIQVAGTPSIRVQESVFTGLWRCLEIDARGHLARDWLEAGAVPRAALDAARAAADAGLPKIDWPAGAMNSPALIAEIDSQLQSRVPGAKAHVINLTLLPLTPDDHAVLERALPVGPLAMISRGFGNCHVTSTLTRDVWRVQYFNSMNTLILNTLEVTDVPEVALASAEDLADSRSRLAELVAWMSESCADPLP